MRLGEILIERRLITQEDLDRALELQRERGDKLGKILVDLGFVAQRDVLAALSEQLQVPLLAIEGPPAVSPETETLSPRFLRQFRCLPVALHDHTVTLAMADPLDFETRSTVASCTGLDGSRRHRAGAGDPGRDRPLLRANREERKPRSRRRTRRRRGSGTSARHGQRGAGHPPGERHDRAGRRKARQRYSHRAVRKRISRPLPHRRRAGESGPAAARAEGRHHFAREADGAAQHRRTPPAAGRPHQDQDPGPRGGSARLHACRRFTAKAWSCACSTAPRAISTISSASASTSTCFRAWSITPRCRTAFFWSPDPPAAANRPRSIPRSSASIRADKKIITIEDPVEYQMDGINQIHVNPQIGLTFAAGLAPHRAPGPGRDHGGRNSRPRNRRHRHPRRAHRPFRVFDAAHQRRSQRHHAPDRHGRRELSDHLFAGGGAGAAAGPRDLPGVQSLGRHRASRPTARPSTCFAARAARTASAPDSAAASAFSN